MPLSALIFDVDGTLLDSNRPHVLAWDLALQQHGYKVAHDRLDKEVGKGGDKLVPSVLGDEIENKHGDSLRKAHNTEYFRIIEKNSIKPFPGITELLTDLRRRGLKTAIATSSKNEELERNQKSANINLTPLFDAIATGDDAPESKPHPGILQAAVKKLNLSPAQCAMVGDTPYDADTARDAGVVCFGLTCGGMNDAPALRATGCREVYQNPADLHAHLDDALRIASPGSLLLTQSVLDNLMREALAVACEALDKDEAPIGCIIARGNGTILARAHNEMNATQNKIAHAEILAFHRAAGKVPPDARDLILVSTLEPCVMCLGASMEAAVDTILFALPAPADGGRSRVRPPTSPASQMPRILGHILSHESRHLFEQFLKRPPNNPSQLQFVKDLLA